MTAAKRNRSSIPLDTSDEARRRQVEAWIAMGPEGRVRLAASMSDEVRRIAAEGHAARNAKSRRKDSDRTSD
jgi:hypothetical protein